MRKIHNGWCAEWAVVAGEERRRPTLTIRGVVDRRRVDQGGDIVLRERVIRSGSPLASQPAPRNCPRYRCSGLSRIRKFSVCPVGTQAPSTLFMRQHTRHHGVLPAFLLAVPCCQVNLSPRLARDSPRDQSPKSRPLCPRAAHRPPLKHRGVSLQGGVRRGVAGRMGRTPGDGAPSS